MILSVVGFSHKTAPLDIRERLAFREAEFGRVLEAFRPLPDVGESLFLSTCNRTEIYMVTSGDPPVSAVADRLGSLRGGLLPSTFESFLSVQQNADAARHLLRVAAGLESMILGESQILGQVRRAFNAAREVSATGPVLNRLTQLAIASGRRVRRETGLSQHASSVPHAVLVFCKGVLGSVRGRRVIIAGAGEMAGLVAKVFTAAGARVTAIANRTLESARLLADRFGAEAIPLQMVGEAVATADVLVATVGAAQPVLRPEDFRIVGDRRVSLLVIDIGIPRGVDPAVAALPGVRLYDLDQMAPRDAGTPIPPEEIAHAEEIVEATLQTFTRWLASRAAVPLIAALRSHTRRIVDEELIRARSRLQGLDDAQRQAVRTVVEASMRKLLHAPFVRLRESAQEDDWRMLALVRELFDLNGEAPDGEHK